MLVCHFTSKQQLYAQVWFDCEQSLFCSKIFERGRLCEYMNGEAASIESCRRQYERNESFSHIIALSQRFSSKRKTARV